MRIAQIVASLESRHGGPSRSVRALSEALARLAGAQVGLLSTQPDADGAPRVEEQLETRIFSRQRPRSLAVSAPLDAHLRACPCDIVHHHGLWLRTLHYAARAARLAGAPLVISPRGMMSPWAWKRHRARKALASCLVHPRALAGADGWHATSEAEARDIRALGFDRPVCIAPNGVTVPSREEMDASARHWHGLAPALNGRRVALFYSRLHAKKRVIELIDLWLSRPRGDWLLLVAGIPEQYSVNQLDAYILRQGGSGRVIVHDGLGNPPPYAAASLFLLPSHSENFGLVVAESLAHAVPALVTDGSPWSELEARGAGACVSWDEYGATLDRLLALDADALDAAGRTGRDWVARSFSWNETARMLMDFYSSLRPAR